jgi:hypothetical protein
MSFYFFGQEWNCLAGQYAILARRSQSRKFWFFYAVIFYRAMVCYRRRIYSVLEISLTMTSASFSDVIVLRIKSSYSSVRDRISLKGSKSKQPNLLLEVWKYFARVLNAFFNPCDLEKIRIFSKPMLYLL